MSITDSNATLEGSNHGSEERVHDALGLGQSLSSAVTVPQNFLDSARNPPTEYTGPVIELGSPAERMRLMLGNRTSCFSQ